MSSADDAAGPQGCSASQRQQQHNPHSNYVGSRPLPDMSADQKALLIGISGVSSSGKTTLARLLRDIFPNTFILHEDDFYKPDNEIPVRNGVADWDCLESLNLPAMNKALSFIKDNGKLPPDLFSKEDSNLMSHSGVDQSTITDLKEQVQASFSGQMRMPIAIIDGFLLFSEEMKEIRELFDIKLLLRTDYKTAKARREARNGYVTLEGFWKDPPGYVDDVVWPNYVKDHAFLFHDGNVEGTVKGDLCETLGVQAVPFSAQGNMTACLHWAYETVRAHLTTTP